jgi:RNA polymerase sigma-70 factor, ECF subfamily
MQLVLTTARGIRGRLGGMKGVACVTSEGPSVERFRSIYLDNYLPILGYALRRTPTEEDANDVVAETFLVLWRRLADAPTGDETRPWLYGIARLIIQNRQRGERRHTRLVARLQALRPIEPGDLRGIEELVSQVMKQLSPRDREVLRLAAWEELTPPEIATALGCSTNAAKIRLHRARKRFAFRLGLLGVQVKPGSETGHQWVKLATEEES